MTSGDGVSVGLTKIVHVTDKAVLVSSSVIREITGADELWVPLTVIHDDSPLSGNEGAGGEGELILQRWWASKEGIE